jgi:hypothetical protein
MARVVLRRSALLSGADLRRDAVRILLGREATPADLERLLPGTSRFEVVRRIGASDKFAARNLRAPGGP